MNNNKKEAVFSSYLIMEKVWHADSVVAEVCVWTPHTKARTQSRESKLEEKFPAVAYYVT